MKLAAFSSKKNVWISGVGEQAQSKVKYSGLIVLENLWQVKSYVTENIAGQLAIELLYFKKWSKRFFKYFKSSILQSSFYLLSSKQQQSLAKVFSLWGKT